MPPKPVAKKKAPAADAEGKPVTAPSAGGSAGASSADQFETTIKAVVRVRPFPSGETAACIEHVPCEGPDALLKILPNVNARSASSRRGDEVKNFDEIFWSVTPTPAGIARPATNLDVFEKIGTPVLDKAFRGINSTVFAYGQTCSGKSFTMGLGEGVPEKDPGLIPKIVEQLFARIASGATADDAPLAPGMSRAYEVRVSFMEVFDDNENGGKVRDLNPYDLFSADQAKRIRTLYTDAVNAERSANPGVTLDALKAILAKVVKAAQADEIETRAKMLFEYRALDQKLRPQFFNQLLPESGHGGLIAGIRGREVGLLAAKKDDLVEDNGHFYPKGLAERRCESAAEVMALLDSGIKRRKTCATDYNEHSSRSHAIVQLRVDTYLVSNEERIKDMTALINLVDLAGSERLDKAGTSKLGRIGETAGINTSLDYLGRVLKGMASSGRSGNVAGSIRMVCLTRLLASSIGGNSETWMVACVNPAAKEWEETNSTLAYAHIARDIKQVVKQNKTGLGDAADAIARLSAQLENMSGETSARVMEKRAELERLERMRAQMEAGVAKERELLVAEKQRRDELVELRAEQRKAFEGQLASLDDKAAAAAAECEDAAQRLAEQVALRKAAEEELKAKEDSIAAARAAHEEALKARFEEIERTIQDRNTAAEEMMREKTAEEKLRSEQERDLEAAAVQLTLQQKKESYLAEELAALKTGDEQRMKELDELKRRVEAATGEVDEHRKMLELQSIQADEMRSKLQGAKQRREELRERLAALESSLRQQRHECTTLKAHIEEREHAISMREQEIAMRNDLLQRRLNELADRELIQRELEEACELKRMEVDELREEEIRVNQHLEELTTLVEACAKSS